MPDLLDSLATYVLFLTLGIVPMYLAGFNVRAFRAARPLPEAET
jgi:hypothetical protein